MRDDGRESKEGAGGGNAARGRADEMRMKIENGGEQMTGGGRVNGDGLTPRGVRLVIGCGCLQRCAARKKEMPKNSGFNLKAFGRKRERERDSE